MSGILLTNAQANEFFDQCDASGDGNISIQELVKVLTDYGLPQASVIEMFRDIDKDGNKQISREEFVGEVCKKSRKDAVEEMFSEIDKDGSGKISLSEMKAYIENKKIDANRLEELFNQVDTDGSGSVDKNEFTQMIVNDF
ncbi:uncharacterized protein LOC127851866 [Dreissena polymorpha]|uniref:EF-hand domain-containing protein n=1 Tax=Dreissena polymorpha TaxID=45954 RepID=A0A9D4N6A1_DREPO|nr:uncharacterized protein LOC127851866 [Dreissena polymorpha]XP_052241784.1 uncharacterized protein LOC127851866 [Dreissena polymorpha]KAH3890508.1 hypothetical protein DPMN_014592 [Dreissena polymorpha]